jgi:hypothetical protein
MLALVPAFLLGECIARLWVRKGLPFTLIPSTGWDKDSEGRGPCTLRRDMCWQPACWAELFKSRGQQPIGPSYIEQKYCRYRKTEVQYIRHIIIAIPSLSGSLSLDRILARLEPLLSKVRASR